MDQDILAKICYSLRQITRYPAKCFTFAEWEKKVRSDGSVTRMNQLPPSYSGMQKAGGYMFAVASGQTNLAPGFDVLRYDFNDYPYVYNTDWYQIIEYLPDDDLYEHVLKQCTLIDTNQLKSDLKEYVFAIGPQKPDDDHWSQNIPERIQNYKII